MKRCPRCGIEKPFDCFVKNRQKKDGYYTYCKPCKYSYQNQKNELHTENRKKYFEEYYRINADKKREYSKQKYHSIKQNLNSYSKFRIRANLSLKISREKNPNHRKAQYTANNAIRSGKLIRPNTCSSCFRECKPEAHHDSYDESQWLSVRWLCRSCHAAHHRKYPEQKTENKLTIT